MTIQFNTDDGIVRQFHSTAEQPVHVPRMKERVEIKDRMYRVVRVTMRIKSDFTSDPLVDIELKRV